MTATLYWDVATPGPLAALRCPNCGADAPKTAAVAIDLHLPGDRLRQFNVLRCPSCACHFYDDPQSADYGEPNLTDRGRVPFYVQQGAGLSLITRPLAQLRRPSPCAYLEVGCGYGFGLDYAIHARSWRGVGVDPGPLAREGRDALGLPIELRYVTDDDASRAAYDVIAGAEVLEHVASPAAFVRTLRAMLRPGGVLILTTPNGDDLRPDMPPGIIIPLLSPTTHVVIQNAQSLTQLLRQAGFAHVRAEIDGHSVVAFASDLPLDLETDASRLRQDLRRHLLHRAAACDPGSDPFLGFAGRAFQESVNDGDMEAADQAWSLLVPACRARFGIDLGQLDAMPPDATNATLESLSRRIPLSLPGLLYASGIRRLFAGIPRPALEARFTLAAEAAAILRRALAALAMEDGQTEDVGWTASAEALLCAAENGAPALPARACALPPAPSGGEARGISFLQRALTTLVNAGHYRLAGDVTRATALHLHPSAAPVCQPRSDTERDALYALAVLALNLPDAAELGGPGLARQRFIRVRDHLRPEDGLWTAAVNGESAAARITTSSTVPAAQAP